MLLKYLLLTVLFFPLSTLAAEFLLTIKDHQFQPAELAVPAGTKIKLRIDNQDSTPEEFDSYLLNREKVIAAHSSAIIFIGPLTPGRYPFTGEFHQATAQGVIVAQ
jgi:hypothetical protein